MKQGNNNVIPTKQSSKQRDEEKCPISNLRSIQNKRGQMNKESSRVHTTKLRSLQQIVRGIETLGAVRDKQRWTS